jgi:hypothetical protein
MAVLTPRGIVQAFGAGEVLRDGALVPGPGHGRADRSLRVFIDPTDPSGFRVHSFAPADNVFACRDYVRDSLGLEPFQPGRRSERPAPTVVKFPAQGANDHEARQRRARVLWGEARDPRGTPVERYWRSRSLELGELAGTVIRFLANTPWRGEDGQLEHVTAMLCAFRDILTDEVTGIHRTRLTLEGEPVLNPDGSKQKKMLGIVTGSAIKLDGHADVTTSLAIGEGVETTESGRLVGYRPAWAVGSAGAIAAFPVLNGIEALHIHAEQNDNGSPNRANADAIETCAARWLAAGRDVFVIDPVGGKDLNDALRALREPTSDDGEPR